MRSTAFDADAAGYDTIAESALGSELRRRVRVVLDRVTAPGDHVADLGCGSGIDAEWLAPQVRRVSAFDVSAEMVALTKDRCRRFSNVATRRADVGTLALDEPVDLVLCNFGVVNCVGDLRAFGHRLQAMVRPGGYAVIVTMPRWCPLELVVGITTGNRELIGRRRGGHYRDIALRYASANRLHDALPRDFELVSAESLGLVLPPIEQRSLLQARPRLLSALAVVDERISRVGAKLGWGDHHITVFRQPALIAGAS